MNFIYIILINLIATAIISGIIIDNFADMRNEREAIDKFNNEYCFICNIKREEFEKNKIDFWKHTQEEHSVEQYCWLKIHVMNKEKTEFTSFESQIYDKIEKEDLSYIPSLQSLSIQTRQKAEISLEEQNKQQLAKIAKDIESIKEYLSQLPSQYQKDNPNLIRWQTLLNAQGKQISLVPNFQGRPSKELNIINMIGSQIQKKSLIENKLFEDETEQKHEEEKDQEDQKKPE